jgi:hypothetical protein
VNRQRYLIDLGDSTTGPIGLVMRVQATDQDGAVTIAAQALRMVSGDCGQIVLKVPDDVRGSVESITIYVNPNAIQRNDIYGPETEAP